MHDTEVGLRNQNADEPGGNWVWFLPTNILLPLRPHLYTLDEDKPLLSPDSKVSLIRI